MEVSMRESQHQDVISSRLVPIDGREIQRSALHRALTDLQNKNRVPKRWHNLGRKYKIVNRYCTLDVSQPAFGFHGVRKSSRNTRTQHLLFTLRNAICHHDWGTAAHCLKLILELRRAHVSSFVFKSLMIILFNHPNTTTTMVKDFMLMVLRLKSKAEQANFLSQVFHLPRDMTQYVKKVLKNQISEDSEDDSD